MDNRSKLMTLAALAVLLLAALPVRAQEELSLVLPSTTSVQDPRAYSNWIDETTANLTVNHLSDTELHIQAGTASPRVANRAILLFDVASVPRSGIKASTLVTHLDLAPTSARTWNLYQMSAFTTDDSSSAADENWLASGELTTWNTAGGDYGLGIASTAVGTTSNVNVTWNVLSLVRQWFGGVPPAPNYGMIITDSNETGASGTVFGELASSNTGTPANAPKLVVDFIQQIQAFKATATTTGVGLSWTYPTAVGSFTPSAFTGPLGLNPTTGIVIVRSTDAPVPDAYLGPTDGTALPALCSVPSTGVTVVFTATTTATTSTTDALSCSAVTGHTYFYKAFAAANTTGVLYNYSTNGTGATSATQDTSFAAEISGTVSATPQAPVWIAPVRASALVAPGIDAGNPVTDKSCDCVIAADNNPILQGFNPTTGKDAIAPLGLGGPVVTRPPVLDGITNDNNSYPGAPFTYILTNTTSGLQYSQETDVDLTRASGSVLDSFNPLLFVVGSLPPFTGGMGVYAKNIAQIVTGVDPEPADLHIFGTQLAANTTGNAIVGEDANNTSNGNGDGWVVIGGTTTSLSCSSTASTAACYLDAVTSTPLVDYVHSTVWVTSHNGGTSAGTADQPDIWKLNVLGCSGTCNGAVNSLNNSEVLAAVNVGSNINSSPGISVDNKIVFVGTPTGASVVNSSLYAFDAVATVAGPPVAPLQLGATLAVNGDGPIKGFPLVLGTAPTYTVIFSTNTMVHSRTFTSGTNVFTTNWDTTLPGNVSSVITSPSAVDTFGTPRPVVYVGCADGKLHELITSTGVDEDARVVNASSTVGDPTLDTSDSLVIVGATDGRIYSFQFPF